MTQIYRNLPHGCTYIHKILELDQNIQLKLYRCLLLGFIIYLYQIRVTRVRLEQEVAAAQLLLMSLGHLDGWGRVKAEAAAVALLHMNLKMGGLLKW
jgi:hypothetical protein